MKWKSIDEVGSTVTHERGKGRETASERDLAKVREASKACGAVEGSTGHHGNPLKADPQCN